MSRLLEIDEMVIYGPKDNHDAVISFQVGNIHHLDMGTLLDRLGIAVRTGHHCAEPLMHRLGIEGTCRANGKYAFGQDRAGDGLWEVAEVKGGFTFRNKASGLYLGGPSARHSRTPVTWECVTRAVRPKS